MSAARRPGRPDELDGLGDLAPRQARHLDAEVDQQGGVALRESGRIHLPEAFRDLGDHGLGQRGVTPTHL
jgi:hypothetical protein